MSSQLNLKEIERKAFRFTYQDGLLDMHYGLIVVCMAIFIYHPETGFSPMNIILSTLLISLSTGLFWAGKKYITLPRMGLVRFGAARQQKKKTLALILGAFVLIQAGLVGLTALGWLNPDVSSQLNKPIDERSSSLLVVSAIASLMVGPSMIVSAYFSDFSRGYYIAILMALAVFLMVYLNQPVYPILIGGLIILPGLVLFVRFLKAYPLQPKDTFDE
jgi:hypothetical protein